MSREPIRLVYDLSVPAGGHYHAASRTGIARVVEEVALQLRAREDIDLSWCAFESLDQWLKAAAYLRSHGDALSAPLLPPVQAGWRLPLLRALWPAPGPARHWHRWPQALAARQRLRLQRREPEGLQRADVFHSTYFPFPDGSERHPRLRRFMTVYDMIPERLPQYIREGERERFRATLDSIRPQDWVLAISESTRRDFIEDRGHDPARVLVTPLAASDAFRPHGDAAAAAATRTRHGIPEGPYLLSLCTFEPRKNIEGVVRSFAALVRQQAIADLNLVLVGTRGWDFQRVLDEIAAAGDLAGRIVVTGYLPDADVAAIYSGALAFAYPSFYEGFGLPPLEAMQCGVPVITSNTSSLPEVVGDAGLVVAPGDGDALSAAMWRLYREPSLRAELSARSLRQAARFSWRRCADETVAAYRLALSAG